MAGGANQADPGRDRREPERPAIDRVRQGAWSRLFPADRPSPLQKLSPGSQAQARLAAAVILRVHREYIDGFQALTAKARETFEDRAWIQSALDAGRRIGLYRNAVDGAWRVLRQRLGDAVLDRDFWLGIREAFLESVFQDYDADLALTLFYSVMRLAFDGLDIPVEYADDGLAKRSHVWRRDPVWISYPAAPEQLTRSIIKAIERHRLRGRFPNLEEEATRASARLLDAWRAEAGAGPPCEFRALKPLFFRDEEAYIVGKLRAGRDELPVVFALRNEPQGLTLDAVLIGREDMRNILLISTRSTFRVAIDGYREILAFLDTLAPERGHPAICALIGFTHPARVELNQRLRQHLSQTNERFARVPGRTGMAMVVFAPPSFPYVFKVIRDYSSKQGWAGRSRIMEIYRWVHEINRERLLLDAWIYRNLHFHRDCFDQDVVDELLAWAPESVRVDGETVILKSVYAQRRVRPLNTLFQEVQDRALRERAADALGGFIRDLAAVGLFSGDCYGLTCNVGLTHGFNAALFDFDDLGPLLRYNFRTTPELSEKDELLWNGEVDGPWFSLGDSDVLVDEWERWLGVPPDLQDYFRGRHGELFTVDYWKQVQARLLAGKLHHVLPYPPERRLRGAVSRQDSQA